jgi:hypothetical protein
MWLVDDVVIETVDLADKFADEELTFSVWLGEGEHTMVGYGATTSDDDET